MKWLKENAGTFALVGVVILAFLLIGEMEDRRTADVKQAQKQVQQEKIARIANARAKQLSGRDSCQVNNARYATIYAALRRTAVAQGYPPESYADLTAALAPTNCITKYPVPDKNGNVPRGSDDQTVKFKRCADAELAGMTPLYRGQPLYESNPELDKDGDGVACE